jgi:nucleotide-binding universal stress UspA family protein
MTYKIFVPVDDSDCARRAVQHAVKMAKLIGDCSIHLAHATDEAFIYGEIEVYTQRDVVEKLQRERAESVLARAAQLLDQAGLRYEKEVLAGPVASTLSERAKALGCDAIIMGTRGLTALADMLMGSTANKIVHLSAIPVTLVK